MNIIHFPLCTFRAISNILNLLVCYSNLSLHLKGGYWGFYFQPNSQIYIASHHFIMHL